LAAEFPLERLHRFPTELAYDSQSNIFDGVFAQSTSGGKKDSEKRVKDLLKDGGG
jgi:hypothetical protein